MGSSGNQSTAADFISSEHSSNGSLQRGFNAAPELYVMGNKGASKDDLTPHWLDVRPLTASERALRRWFDPGCGFARKRRNGNDCGVPQNHIQERILWNSTSTFQIPDDKIPGAKTAHTDDRID